MYESGDETGGGVAVGFIGAAESNDRCSAAQMNCAHGRSADIERNQNGAAVR